MRMRTEAANHPLPGWFRCVFRDNKTPRIYLGHGWVVKPAIIFGHTPGVVPQLIALYLNISNIYIYRTWRRHDEYACIRLLLIPLFEVTLCLTFVCFVTNITSAWTKGNIYYIASYIIFELWQVPCTYIVRILGNVNIFYVSTEWKVMPLNLFRLKM